MSLSELVEHYQPILTTYWPIVVAIGAVMTGLLLFLRDLLNLRKLTLENEKIKLELDKIKKVQKDSESKILRPTDDEIGAYGRPYATIVKYQNSTTAIILTVAVVCGLILAVYPFGESIRYKIVEWHETLAGPVRQTGVFNELERSIVEFDLTKLQLIRALREGNGEQKIYVLAKKLIEIHGNISRLRNDKWCIDLELKNVFGEEIISLLSAEQIKYITEHIQAICNGK